MAGRQQYRVKLSVRASRDLCSVFDYIAAGSPQNAAGMIERLLNAIDGLEVLPHRYPLPHHAEAETADVRSIPVGKYLVLYTVDEPSRLVQVVSVRHGSRRLDF